MVDLVALIRNSGLASVTGVTAGTPVTDHWSVTKKLNRNRGVTGVPGVMAVTCPLAAQGVTGYGMAGTLGLQGDCGGFTDIDDISDFEERAAILEFDGGLSRPAAEATAHAELAEVIPFRSRRDA